MLGTRIGHWVARLRWVLCLLPVLAGPTRSRAETLPAEEPVLMAPDAECLRWLDEHHVHYTAAGPTLGVRTPLIVSGLLGSVSLVSLGKRPALMDCELSRALVEAGPVFEGLGITELGFSAAYDYRSRHDSPQLSKHSNGFAIDVHTFGGPGGSFVVERDFEPGVGSWLELPKVGASEEACIGTPLTAAGRTLRTLACRLKLHPAFRVIVTLDDNADHRSHFHLESFPSLAARNDRSRIGHHPTGVPTIALSAPESEAQSQPRMEDGGRAQTTHRKRHALKRHVLKKGAKKVGAKQKKKHLPRRPLVNSAPASHTR